MESGDWRSQLQADSRQRIVNRIIDTLKRHLPYSGNEGLQELNIIAGRFEEKIYTAATSQSDYLRKISLKMLNMEIRPLSPMPDAMQSYSTANSVNPSYPGLNSIIKQEMDTSNWRPTQGGSGGGGHSSMESGDWRSQLQADSRQRIVNKIVDTLKKHLPYSGHEGLQELNEIAVRFEEKIYTDATSQSDYLRKISLKMLTIFTTSQNPMPDAMQSYSTANRVNPSDPGTRYAT
ncbi:hypothetical protein L6452_32259 [Arctium lappa]|uniref:Uncharacterized protein n=1 Tax=Arctium lappa TaxID=4217 RepID=A0ACB8Z4B2_ARCLA|nr:hypothetical protein L6452_32259 [Arctium lappa]